MYGLTWSPLWHCELEGRKRPNSEGKEEVNRTTEGVRLPNGRGDGDVCRGGVLKKGEWFDGVADGDVVVAGSRIEWCDCYGDDDMK
ncbi:hypothetical protein LR48_Vigan06g067400 [Vigna angularis]|uniref:Uncharacterized protein n=1 Tax=Phaseolus angularis TaxID=3914 RepID=A0A0L9URI5_PHAAN|nr:hypothetical protein LR48_Vigan06g067400 [Vigna angularis]